MDLFEELMVLVADLDFVWSISRDAAPQTMRRLVLPILLLGCQQKTAVTIAVIDAGRPLPPPPVASAPPSASPSSDIVDAGDSSEAIIAEMNAMKPATGAITLPAVACKGGGQMGPHAIPIPKNHQAPMTKALAALPSPEKTLALYYGDNFSVVLAPIGWHCESVMGSGGSATWVMPPGVTSPNKMKGNAVVHHQHIGGTSGRFSVVDIGAPLFPSMGRMVRAVAKQWPEMVKQPAPYVRKPGETAWIAKSLVRFVDDPNVSGLGTNGGDLVASDAPIHGSIRAISNGDDNAGIGAFDLQTFVVRLDTPALIPVIQADFEDRSMRPNPQP